jgi:hypothetical protein
MPPPWDNNRLWEVPLRTAYEQSVYLPVVMKDY